MNRKFRRIFKEFSSNLERREAEKRGLTREEMSLHVDALRLAPEYRRKVS